MKAGIRGARGARRARGAWQVFWRIYYANARGGKGRACFF